MIRRKTSRIWLITKKDLQELLDASGSMCDILRAFGLNPYTGNHTTLKKRIKEDRLSLIKFKQNKVEFDKVKHEKLSKNNIRPLDEILVKNSTYNCGSNLKKRLLDSKILDNKCYGDNCSITTTWNGFPISLQLDHINGINNDNRKENLRLLCPNCHSQTETFSGKRLKKEKMYELPETRKLRLIKSRKVKERPDLVTLLTKIKSSGYLGTGRQYGVSDNTIRKWVKQYKRQSSVVGS